MREFSLEVKSLLAKDNVVAFFLVLWGGAESFNIRHTSFPHDLTVTDNLNLDMYLPNSSTFRAENGLMSIDAPRLSDVLDREIYKISYIDNNLSMFNLIRDELGEYGALCSVWIGFINTLDVSLDGYSPGDPLLDAKHLILAYRGNLDTYGIAVDHNGAKITTFELASPMAALDMSKPILTSQEAQQRYNPGDACYNHVHVNSATVTLKWGKL